MAGPSVEFSLRRVAALPAAVVALAALLAFSPSVSARGELDQVSPPGISSLPVNVSIAHAMTVRAGRSGFLDLVELPLASASREGRFTVDVLATDVAGAPAGPPLASRSIDACRVREVGGARPFPVTFGPAAPVIAGTRYAIVLAFEDRSGLPVDGLAPQVNWTLGYYPDGAAFAASPGASPAWRPAQFGQLAFSTYVSSTAPQTVVHDATSTTLTADRNPAPPGTQTYTATVTNPGQPERVPTGIVYFRVLGWSTADWWAPVDEQGRASIDFTNIPKGTWTMTASYCPDTDAFASSSSMMQQRIERDWTDIKVTATPAEISVGERTTLTATVTNVEHPEKTPTGTIQFEEGSGKPLSAPVPMNAGTASWSTVDLPAGTQFVNAFYRSADGLFEPVRGVVPVTVRRWASQTVVAVDPLRVVAGQDVTIAADVDGLASDGHRPTGTVRFMAGADDPGSLVPIDANGQATIVAWAHAGSYRVSAHYDGDGYFDPSEAAATTELIVDRARTATTIASNPNPVTAGRELSVSVDVSVLAPGDVDLDGALQFEVDGQAIGEPVGLFGFTGVDVTLIAPDTPGVGTITARYLGGDDTEPSSASLAQTVLAAPTAGSTPAPAPAPSPSVPVTTATIRTAMGDMIAGLRARLRSRGLRALPGLTETFVAPAAGRLRQQIFTPSVSRKSVLLASGSARFTSARAGTVKLKLTAAGRRALRRLKGRVEVAVVTRFAAVSGVTVRRVDRFTVRPRGRASLTLPRSASWSVATTEMGPPREGERGAGRSAASLHLDRGTAR